jgi:hypothetical protein
VGTPLESGTTGTTPWTDTGPVSVAVAVPNPSRSNTRIRFENPAEGIVRGGVFDVTGRRVADLGPVRSTAGPVTLVGNGRGLDGSRLPAGVYFARVAGPDRTAAVRLVRVKR